MPPSQSLTQEPEAKDPPAERPEDVGKLATEALSTLAKIMREGSSDTVRIAACNALLDRAHGKPRSGAMGEAAEAPVPTRVTVRFV